MHEQVSKLD